MFEAWIRELGSACELYAEARRLQHEAELEELQAEQALVTDQTRATLVPLIPVYEEDAAGLVERSASASVSPPPPPESAEEDGQPRDDRSEEGSGSDIVSTTVTSSDSIVPTTTNDKSDMAT
jgi:hypothetical protein